MSLAGCPTNRSQDTLYTPAGSRWKTVWVYDARGRVRVREDYSWYGPGSYFIRDRSARYLYDGMRVIQERNENNTPLVTYTRGLDLAGSWERAGGIGGLLARTAHSGVNGATYTPAFYHADGNGNVTYLLKLDQTMGATYTFDPYGRQLASSGTLANANTYRFSSKELMLASGLYYYGYRFYDPNTQRWLNRDPIEEEGGINLYRFANNTPALYVDTDGRVVFIPMIIGGLGGMLFEGAMQALKYGDNWECYDVGDMLIGGAVGAMGFGALGNGYKAIKAARIANAFGRAKLIPTGIRQYAGHKMKQEMKGAITKGALGIAAGMAGKAVTDTPPVTGGAKDNCK